jgi:thiamine-monophosphate kinase
VDLVGGDTSASPKGLFISVTAIGEVAPGEFVTRSGAKPGDLICVSGDLGGAFLGLTLLEREKKIYMESPQVQPDLEDQRYIIGRLLKPEARKDIIEFFAVAGIKPTAMMDISDGLSSELLHICRQSGVGCLIYEDKLPIDEDTRNFAYKLELDPTACALSGGEDYELLFTVPQSDYDKIATNAQISVIGYVTESAEWSHILTKGGNKYPITAQGWKAF